MPFPMTDKELSLHLGQNHSLLYIHPYVKSVDCDFPPLILISDSAEKCTNLV